MPPVISVLCAPSECLNVFTSGSAWKSARNSGCAAVQLWFFGPQPSIYVGAPLCNCGSSDHSLRWCPAPFANVFSLLNPEFVTHDADGSIFETWKQKMRHWHRRGPNRQPQGNGRRSALVRGAPHYRYGAGRELPVPGSQPASDGDAERHLEASVVEKEKEKTWHSIRRIAYSTSNPNAMPRFSFYFSTTLASR